MQRTQGLLARGVVPHMQRNWPASLGALPNMIELEPHQRLHQSCTGLQVYRSVTLYAAKHGQVSHGALRCSGSNSGGNDGRSTMEEMGVQYGQYPPYVGTLSSSNLR